MIIPALYRILPLTHSLPIMRRTNRDEGTGHILASPAPDDDPSPPTTTYYRCYTLTRYSLPNTFSPPSWGSFFLLSRSACHKFSCLRSKLRRARYRQPTLYGATTVQWLSTLHLSPQPQGIFFFSALWLHINCYSSSRSGSDQFTISNLVTRLISSAARVLIPGPILAVIYGLVTLS